MEWLWSSPGQEVSVREVTDALPEYAYTTVATVLDRLVAKGVLRSRMVARAKRYSTSGNRGSHTAVLMYDALAADREPAQALRRFVENLTPAEMAALRDALNDARAKGR
jgi:predicted transcriptional regulator